MRIQYRLRDGVELYESGNTAALVCTTSGKTLTLSADIAPIAKGLQSGWLTEDEAVEDINALSQGYFAFIQMQKAGMLDARVTNDAKTIFSISPSPEDSAFKNQLKSSATYQLNRYAYMRQENDCLLLESPLTMSRVTVFDTKLAGMLHQLCSGLRLDIAGEEAKTFLSALVAIGMADPVNDQPQNDPMEFWEFHDLLYSARSLNDRHVYPVGGTYHFHGKRPTLPAIRPSISKDTIDLLKPSGDLADRLNRPFNNVLNERRSIREYADTPLTLEELGAFLHASAKISTTTKDPDHNDEVTIRPSPSGGARHALEIYPLIRECAGVEPGAYRYDAKNHRLELLTMEEQKLERLLEDNPFEFLGGGPPQITLNISARIGRTAWKYESIAYKLINQDMGCLYQTFYLVATALGLAPCALGSVDARKLGEVHDIDWREEPFIGAFTLGK